MSIKILVVEDAQYQRAICVHHLNQVGFDSVIQAGDGVEAFSLLKDNPVDLILSDWEMPEMNGLELLKKVRATPAYKDIPFIMLTASDDEKIKKNAVDAGVTDFSIKPFTPGMIKETIGKIFPGL